MKTLHFEIEINALVNTVYETMLSANGFKHWAKSFHPNPYFEGNWEKNSKMRFLVKEENGNVMGMASQVLEHIPNSFVSIQHQNYIRNGIEMQEGNDFYGALEQYRFEALAKGTLVKLHADTTPQHEDYFIEAWPKALQNLKKLIEG